MSRREEEWAGVSFSNLGVILALTRPSLTDPRSCRRGNVGAERQYRDKRVWLGNPGQRRRLGDAQGGCGWPQDGGHTCCIRGFGSFAGFADGEVENCDGDQPAR